MHKPSVFIIFLTVFIDLIGFGIVLPLIPIYSRDFAEAGGIESGELLGGLIMASFSAMQFIFAPMWGRLSDRIGRRPVILIGLAGSTMSYAVFAIASGLEGEAKSVALWIILGSRLLAGVMGANISVAQAYMADITPPEKRSKSMGLIGMAFGLGFILGPFISAQALSFFGLQGPGWVAVGICGFAFLFAAAKIAGKCWRRGEQGRSASSFRTDRSCSENAAGRFVDRTVFSRDVLLHDLRNHPGLVGREQFQSGHGEGEGCPDDKLPVCLCRFRRGDGAGRGDRSAREDVWEKKLIVISLLLTGASLGPLPFAKAWLPFLAVLGGLAVGSSLARAPIFGMISILASDKEQGATIGVAQSAGSLARILGPIFAGACFQYRQELPYVICAGVSVLAALIAMVALKDVKHEPAPNEKSDTPEPAPSET